MKPCDASAIFLCNGATPADGLELSDYTVLDYRPSGNKPPMVRLGLPGFVRSVNYLPSRCLDLLEIAAYVFAADRLTPRGSREAVEFQAWSRRLHFIVRVRDYEFWREPSVSEALKSALRFATGDQSYEFTFQAGHATPPTGLFDDEAFSMEVGGDLSIMLFSGGIDSLAGAVQRLEQTREHVCLVSHLSQVGTIRTQRGLASALQRDFRGRVSPYQFKTHLQGVRSKEETQRSRPFLFGSIAFALSTAFGRDRFYIYENGVTSLNFARRDDLVNARASRTTHPQTVGRLASLFSIIAEKPFALEVPFLWYTKSDVVESLKDSGHGHLLPSSVSCSHTYNSGLNATHCGECFQCLDRRIGIYGADANRLDNESLYATNIIASSIPSTEGKTTAVDYLRQAANFSNWNEHYFYNQTLDELQILLGWVPGYEDENELVDKIWDLCSRHGEQVALALRRMRDVHEGVFSPLAPDSLLKVVSDREFLKAPIERLVTSIENRLESALPKSFQSVRPTNEADLNDKIEGLLDTWRDDLQREHPSVPFARAGVVPDFSLDRGHLLIEGKYIRGATTPSRITEGMAADLTKYPQEAHILFVVYDPDSAVVDRARLKRDFEDRGRCTVCVLP